MYIASCGGTPCAQIDGSTAKWAKIAQVGQKAKFSKTWVQGDLGEHLYRVHDLIVLHTEHAGAATGQPYSFSLPDNLKSGEYLLRPEVRCPVGYLASLPCAELCIRSYLCRTRCQRTAPSSTSPASSSTSPALGTASPIPPSAFRAHIVRVTRVSRSM